MAENNTPKPKKKKGIIRTEAVVPFLIVTALTFIYFHFFFDLHLKKAFEYAGYQLLGAEVDIDKVETSFFKGTFEVRGIQLTNSEKPTHNMVQIGDIRFGVLWDGLLRARLVVDEMAAEQIQIDVPRKHPGKVKPVEPPKPEEASSDGKPSALDKAKDKALGTVESKFNNNALGDIAAILGGTSSTDQIGKIEGSLASKARLKEIEADYQAKQKKWQEMAQSLPKGPEIQALGDRLGKVKTKDFKSPQEVQQSLQEIDAILKEADAKYKNVQTTGAQLNTDIQAFNQNLKDLDTMVKNDIKDLETRFKLPSLDAKSLSQSIFYPYLAPYLAKFTRYKDLVHKYAPPNLMKKDKKDEPAAIQPRPRAKGIVYEFIRTKSYPMFWIKRISISSKAGPGAHSGDLKGLITDVTSNQLLVGKPTVAKIEGSVPDMQVSDFLGQLTIDNRQEQLHLNYDFKVGSYALDGRELVQSPDVQVGFKKANGSLTSQGELIGLNNFSFSLSNQFKNVDFAVTAKNSTVEEIVKAAFASLPAITVNADGHGSLPAIALNVNSNLGPELTKGFEKQLQAKLADARAKLQAYVDEQVGKEKAKFETEFNKSKSQVEGEVKKVQDQLNAEKSKAEAKVTQAKKDGENQARKGVEDQVKKAIGPDGDKKLDDLKKRFGF
jgi:uncharacterized protein (TIGR03545 family)